MARKWVNDYWGPKPPLKVNEADLFGGGHIEGDDADEFLEAFMDKFKVDVSGFEPWLHYIADEPSSMMGRRIVPVGADGDVIPFLPISIEDLARAVEAGVWDGNYPAYKLIRRRWAVVLQYLFITAIALWIAASFFL